MSNLSIIGNLTEFRPVLVQVFNEIQKFSTSAFFQGQALQHWGTEYSVLSLKFSLKQVIIQNIWSVTGHQNYSGNILLKYDKPINVVLSFLCRC